MGMCRSAASAVGVRRGSTTISLKGAALSVRRRSIHLAQEQLALMLSISRQTTNQILKELEAQGAVHLNYGEIEILDPELLKRAAQGKP